MESLCVRSVTEDDGLQIVFYHDGKKFEFNRKKQDNLQNTLQRISLKLQPKKQRKKQKKGDDLSRTSTDDVTVQLVRDDTVIPGDWTNADGFVPGSYLNINDVSYAVKVNVPTVTQLNLPDNIMNGFQVFPDVSFEFASVSHSKFDWYTSTSNASSSEEWQHVGNGFTYIPSVGDINRFLKCAVKPGNIHCIGPFCFDTVSPVLISAGPGSCFFDDRHLYTKKYLLDRNEFRIVSYNILADVFADTEYAREVLFPYVPHYAIKAKYRRQLIIKELLGYHADIICLQECQRSMFDHYLKPLLEMNGYHSAFYVKLGEMPEGEAFFYRKEKFECVRDFSMSIRDAMELPCNAELLSNFENVTEFLSKVRLKTAIGQILLLKERSGKRYVCVLNTHLYYKRYAVRIRLMQLSILMNYIHHVLKKDEISAAVSLDDVSFVVCGDLNCIKDAAPLDYLSGKKITKSNPVWHKNEEGEFEHFDIDVTLTCPIALRNVSGDPSFTVYVPHCKTTLDYVYASNDLDVNAFVPLPQPCQIEPYVGLPCVVHPSDHLALVMDLKWKECDKFF